MLAKSTTSEQLLGLLVVLQPGLRLDPGDARACLSVSNHLKEIPVSSALSLILNSAYELEARCCVGPFVGRNNSFILSLIPMV